MEATTIVLVAALMGLGAMLYTSVGHAGASAYLAIMALFAIDPAVMRPTALVLNVLVAGFATWRFVRAGQFNASLMVPFVIGAVPCAFLAGRFPLSPDLYRPVVAAVLFLAAIRLLWPRPIAALETPVAPHPLVRVLAGAGIGTLSGLTGTGGGIFLSPLILLMGWESARRTAGVSSAFILCVSLSGLMGSLSTVGRLPVELPYFVVAVGIGAVIGTRVGTSRIPSGRLLQLLGLVLLIASAKLAFS